MLYYWEDSESDLQRGWWFGTELGGNMVWVRHPSSTSAARDKPPRKGWVLHSNSQPTPLRVLFCEARGPRQEVPLLRTSPGRERRAMSPETGTWDPNVNVHEVATPQRNSKRRAEEQEADDGDREAREALEAAQARAQASTKRRYEELKADREQQFRDWLMNLDGGAGAMMQYFDRLATEFDADLTQIKACRVPQDGEGKEDARLDTIDPILWEIVGIKKLGHRMLFARGIAALGN